MRPVFLFASLLIMALGCKGTNEHKEAYAKAVERMKALGLVTSESDAIAQYKGGSTSHYYRFSNADYKLAIKIREYRRGGDRAKMAAYLKEFSAAGDLEMAAVKGSIPAKVDLEKFGMVSTYQSMSLAGNFFRARAVYRAEAGDINDAIEDVLRIVQIDEQISVAIDPFVASISCGLANDVASAAADVAAFCTGNPTKLGSLQRAVAEIPPPNFRPTLGYCIVFQKRICDDLRSGKLDFDSLGLAGASSISSADIDLAEANAAKMTADVAEAFPDLEKISAIHSPEPDGAASVLTGYIFEGVSHLAGLQVEKGARQEMALLGLDALIKRSKTHQWDLSAITISIDGFSRSGPYRAVATENSLKIYSVGMNGKDDSGRSDDVIGFDYKDR
jgi:hypothetical protein